MTVVVKSFSFRRGVPTDADMLFDVRFLKNPFYDPTLKTSTGLDKAAGQYIERDPAFSAFFQHLQGVLTAMLPRYLKEVKTPLTIGIGCTGGQHRSVYLAQTLGAWLQSAQYHVTIIHRDLEQQ